MVIAKALQLLSPIFAIMTGKVSPPDPSCSIVTVREFTTRDICNRDERGSQLADRQGSQTNRHTDSLTDRQTTNQRDKMIGRPTDRQTNGQTEQRAIEGLTVSSLTVAESEPGPCGGSTADSSPSSSSLPPSRWGFMYQRDLSSCFGTQRLGGKVVTASSSWSCKWKVDVACYMHVKTCHMHVKHVTCITQTCHMHVTLKSQLDCQCSSAPIWPTPGLLDVPIENHP